MEITLTTCSVDPVRGRVVWQDGREESLTAIECDLVSFLNRRPGEPVTRQELLSRVWGYSDDVVSRAADNAIARLRGKIEGDPGRPVHLRTVHGVGYMWVPEGATELAPPSPQTPRRLRLPDRVLDLTTGASVSGPAVSLTATEVRLLEALEAAAPQPLTREELLAQVWGGKGNPRAVDAAVWRLRAKIEVDAKAPRCLLSVRGRGYRLEVGATPVPARRGSTFFGRQREQSELESALASAQLVSLVGPGGAGKTRLAQRLAHEQAAIWIDLTECRTRADLAAELAEALGLHSAEEPGVERALAALGPATVVLDNFEQLLACAPVVSSLIDAAPDVRFLVTSRVPLGLEHEALVRIGSLDRDNAVAMLRDRARVGLGASDAEALVELLDDLPLAIELAAAKVEVIGADALRERLAATPLQMLRRPSDRSRHGALSLALSHSWELLEPWQRQAMIQLSAFRGSYRFEAAEAVLELTEPDAPSDAATVLQALRDHSLLRTVPQPDQPGRVRLAPFVAVDAFVRNQGEDPGARARHAAWFERFSDLDPTSARRRNDPDPIEGFPALNAERSNIEAALDWAVDHGSIEQQVRLTRALTDLRAGWGDYLPELFDGVLERTEGALKALVHQDRIDLFFARTDYDEAMAEARRAEELGRLHDTRVLGRALVRQAFASTLLDPERARVLCEQALALHDDRQITDEDAVSALQVQSDAIFPTDPHAGRALSFRAIGLARSSTSPGTLGRMLSRAAFTELHHGRAGLAEQLARESLQALASYRAVEMVPRASDSLALALRALGRIDEAAAVARPAMDDVRRLGLKMMSATLGLTLALIETDRDPSAAREYVGEVQDLLDAGAPIHPLWSEACLADIHLHLGELDAAEYRARTAMALTGLPPYALSLPGTVLARVHLERREPAPARALLEHASAARLADLDRALLAALWGRLLVLEGDRAGAEERLREARHLTTGTTNRAPSAREVTRLEEALS